MRVFLGKKGNLCTSCLVFEVPKPVFLQGLVERTTKFMFNRYYYVRIPRYITTKVMRDVTSKTRNYSRSKINENGTATSSLCF